MSADLPCRELVELVTDYLEDRVPPELRARIEEHLTVCAGCRTYLEQIRSTRDAVGQVADDALSPAAWATLRSVFGSTGPR